MVHLDGSEASLIQFLFCLVALLACTLIGFALGALGAFLGIGGGPFNMAAMYLFFSMPTRQARRTACTSS